MALTHITLPLDLNLNLNLNVCSASWPQQQQQFSVLFCSAVAPPTAESVSTRTNKYMQRIYACEQATRRATWCTCTSATARCSGGTRRWSRSRRRRRSTRASATRSPSTPCASPNTSGTPSTNNSYAFAVWSYTRTGSTRTRMFTSRDEHLCASACACECACGLCNGEPAICSLRVLRACAATRTPARPSSCWTSAASPTSSRWTHACRSSTPSPRRSPGIYSIACHFIFLFPPITGLLLSECCQLHFLNWATCFLERCLKSWQHILVLYY